MKYFKNTSKKPLIMKEINKEESLKKILELNNKYNVSAYEIAKKTGLTEAGIGKLFNGVTKSPNISTIEKLLNFYSNYNENNLVKDNSDVKPEEKNSLFKSIPFYDINISAGNIVFLDGGLLKDKEPDDWFDIPKSVDADIAFPTYGHSMSPVITNGDKVAYKFITDWSFFNYGMKYMIVTDEQRMVKYLKKHSKEGYVLLESENPDYDPIDMPISSIRNILQVRYIGKIEM